MGTYHSSKYVVSRKSFNCAACGRFVSANVQYLAFKPGLKRTTKVCQQCSTQPNTRGGLNWPCYAVEQHIAAAARGFSSEVPIAARLADPTSGNSSG